MDRSHSWRGRGLSRDFSLVTLVHPIILEVFTKCKGTMMQLICWMQVADRTESAWEGQDQTGKRGGPLVGFTGAVDWEGAASVGAFLMLKYLPAMTYFPTPSPEQYRRR